jgi:hypothetical protein
MEVRDSPLFLICSFLKIVSIVLIFHFDTWVHSISTIFTFLYPFLRSSSLSLVPTPGQDLFYFPVVHFWKKILLFTYDSQIRSFIMLFPCVYVILIDQENCRRWKPQGKKGGNCSNSLYLQQYAPYFPSPPVGVFPVFINWTLTKKYGSYSYFHHVGDE